MEWRISFSVAERTLVWSFSHVQIQCYAIMKIILKEFINPHCSPDNRVLCSYFIKTFLFWKYEETDPSFWCQENLGDCIVFLLCGFYKYIFQGLLKHYFIPEFNLFSVKLSPEALLEILRILNIISQSDISIMKKCNALRPIWDKFVNYTDPSVSHDSVRRRQGNLLKTDACFMSKIVTMQRDIFVNDKLDLLSLLYQLVSRFFQNVQTKDLVMFAVQIISFRLSKKVVSNYQTNMCNKTFYKPCRYLHLNISGFDISTNRLLYAMLMTIRGDHCLSLRVINNVLSNVPPFTLYCSYVDLPYLSNEIRNWYFDVFSSYSTPVAVRARKAWMLDILLMPTDIDTVPAAAAIQIELAHCDKRFGVR